MPKFVVFKAPQEAWEGYDYLDDLVDLKPNTLRFAVVAAKNMEQAREKWFFEIFYPEIEEWRIMDAANTIEGIFENHNEKTLIERFGEKDGKAIWQLNVDAGGDELQRDDIEKTAGQLSDETIKRLVFEYYMYDICVSAIEKFIE